MQAKVDAVISMPGISQKEFQLLRDLIYREAGISLNENKIELVRGRLGKRLKQHGLRSFRDYYEFVTKDRNGEELTAFIDAISTNKTDFFREISHFEYLEKKLLPNLIEQKRGTGDRRLRIWCAASSTGEEPYTIALVLNRLGLLDNLNWDTKILATDISTKALALAQKGEYAPARVSPVPLNEMKTSFARLPNGSYQVVPALKRSVKFGRVNLLEEPFPFRGPFDMVFCRNVMIYFDVPTREHLVNRIHAYLAPGGHFFIGKSESLNGLKHHFGYVMPSVYRKNA